MIKEKSTGSSSYRNKEWYLPIIKGMDMAGAYKFISEHLKAPSFVYEPDNAAAAFKEVFGRDYASPQEMAAQSAAEKIRELEAENAKLKALAQAGEVAGEEKTEDVTDKLTQDQFAAEHTEIPAGLKMYHAYQKYLKEK
jgi:hypothetical protein